MKIKNAVQNNRYSIIFLFFIFWESRFMNKPARRRQRLTIFDPVKSRKIKKHYTGQVEK